MLHNIEQESGSKSRVRSLWNWPVTRPDPAQIADPVTRFQLWSTANCSKESAHEVDNASGIRMRSNSTSTVTPWASNQLADLEGLAADRTSWRARCQQAVVNFEESRVVTLKINEGNARQAKSTHLLPLTFNVTCAEESAAPRSDCSPTDELTRDQRSVVSTAQSIH